jgi:hypothetical protein
MSSYQQILEAITFSYNAMTWITWLVLTFGVLKTVQAFIKAYENNDTYDQMRTNPDKTGIVQFYYGVIISLLCVFIFFLPYLFHK